MTRVAVHLRDTVLGVDGVYQMDIEDRYLENIPFLFEHGNYSCDCNRSNFLAEVRDDGYDTDLACNGGPNRVVVDRIVSEDGAILYRDEG